MNDYNSIEKEIARKYEMRDKKKRTRMKITGKSVFLIQKLRMRNKSNIIKKHKK